MHETCTTPLDTLKNSVRLIKFVLFENTIFFYTFHIYFNVKMILKVRLKTSEFKIFSQKKKKKKNPATFDLNVIV